MKRPLPKGTILHSERATEVFKGVRYTVYQWKQKLFNGQTATFETVKRNDSAIVIPIIGDKVILTKEKQPHIAEPYLGFPAGNVEDGEDIYDGARRELLEETGMVFKNLDLVYIKKYMPGIEWFGYTFVATGYERTGETKFDGGEKIETVAVSFSELIDLVKRGEFMYPPRFIEEYIMRGETEKLFDLFKNPSKYKIQ